MKDQLLLLAAGVFCAAFASLFFRVTGEYSTWGLFIGFLITVVAYFRRKRRDKGNNFPPKE